MIVNLQLVTVFSCVKLLYFIGQSHLKFWEMKGKLVISGGNYSLPFVWCWSTESRVTQLLRSVGVVNSYFKLHLLVFHWNHHLSFVTGCRRSAFCELKNCRETITSAQESSLTLRGPIDQGRNLSSFVHLFLALLVF